MELDTLKSVDTAVSFTGRQLDTAHSVNRNRDTEKSDSHASQDESVIARFGKKQQLKVCSCAVLCVIVLIWSIASIQ